ncbi:MAG TPA: M56 family metallopeptidase [Kofleriaceae bacterium]|nr:M56 family metallopeptidase [Kofleriaceae bacterium]
MSRELVLATMVLVLGGAGAWLASWVPAAPELGDRRERSGRQLEARSWRRIWLTLLPAGIALATMSGWALQEPGVTDEPLLPTAALIAVPIGLVWLRCALRACVALRRPGELPPIATVGLLAPRVVVSDEVRGALDPAALDAALAHERVHVRRRDPLRIWLAQIATDLQWPSPSARRRFAHWLGALELARDEEARLDGAPGEDLAAAVVAVARLPRRGPGAAIAGLTGAEVSLASRVHRLLEPVPPDGGRRSIALRLAIVALLAASVAIGATHGDDVLRAMPFIAG